MKYTLMYGVLECADDNWIRNALTIVRWSPSCVTRSKCQYFAMCEYVLHNWLFWACRWFLPNSMGVWRPCWVLGLVTVLAHPVTGGAWERQLMQSLWTLSSSVYIWIRAVQIRRSHLNNGNRSKYLCLIKKMVLNDFLTPLERLEVLIQ